MCIYDVLLNDYWRFPPNSSSDPVILRDESQVTILVHLSQAPNFCCKVDITSIKWQPLSRNCLAVGCRAGVCLWTITQGTTNCAGVAPGDDMEQHQGRPVIVNGSNEIPRSMREHAFSEVCRVLNIEKSYHRTAGASLDVYFELSQSWVNSHSGMESRWYALASHPIQTHMHLKRSTDRQWLCKRSKHSSVGCGHRGTHSNESDACWHHRFRVVAIWPLPLRGDNVSIRHWATIL